MFEGLAKISLLLGRLYEIFKSAQEVIDQLGNSTAAKILVVVFIVGSVLYLYRRYFLKPHFDSHEKETRSRLAVAGFVAFPTLAVVVLGTVMIPVAPKNEPVAPTVEAKQRHPVPGQLTCADGNCGVGGPAIDPKEYPNKLSPEDFAQYLKSVNGSSKVPTVCTVFGRANDSSQALYDINVRLPSGGSCERFFEASPVATELTLLRPPSHGGITVRNRSFKYSSVGGYHGGDTFLLKQCLMTQDMSRPSCTILRYTVDTE